MEEHFDVCDEAGVPTGEALPRSEVHRRGLWHRSAHLWVFNSRGEVLLQRRHPDKETDPGRWDIAVAGHLSAGQTPLEAMVREAQEELGLILDPQSLVPLGVWTKEYVQPGFLDREKQHLFVTRWDGQLDELVLQADEVTAVRWMGLEDFRKVVQTEDSAYVGRKDDSAVAFAWMDERGS